MPWAAWLIIVLGSVGLGVTCEHLYANGQSLAASALCTMALLATYFITNDVRIDELHKRDRKRAADETTAWGDDANMYLS